MIESTEYIWIYCAYCDEEYTTEEDATECPICLEKIDTDE